MKKILIFILFLFFTIKSYSQVQVTEFVKTNSPADFVKKIKLDMNKKQILISIDTVTNVVSITYDPRKVEQFEIKQIVCTLKESDPSKNVAKSDK